MNHRSPLLGLSCAAVLLFSGMGRFVGAPSDRLAAQSGKIRIAVLNFENNSTWTWWGDHLGEAAADELVTQLFKSGAYSVIERQQLNAILDEQDLAQSGRINAATAAQIGQILGVQLIVTGSITKFSIERVSGGFARIRGSYSKAESNLDVRMIDTKTAEILFAEEGSGKKRLGGGFIKGAGAEREFDAGLAAESLRPAVEDVVNKIVRAADRFANLEPVAPAGQIVGVRGDSFYINRGENFGVEVGQKFDVYQVIDEIRDADGNLLDQITDKAGVLEVTRVLGQSAICTLVEGKAAKGDGVRGR